jgi:hypothetical protein
MSSPQTILDSTGTAVPIPSYSQAITYNGDGTIATITATDPKSGMSWTQTFSYVGGLAQNANPPWVPNR